jgi:RNA polymerase sigma-70 factor (ECF subfamily)
MAVPVDLESCCWCSRKARARAASRFEVLYLDHEAELFRYVARRVGPATAETALAEVFALAWQRFAERDGGVTPRNWLIAIAIEQLRRGSDAELDHLRRFATTGIDPLASGSTSLRADELLAPVVAGALAELSGADRDVLTLHLWVGMSPESIAEVLGLEACRVAARLDRAGRFVRGRIERARAELDADPI